jgi:hypothetical protein
LTRLAARDELGLGLHQPLRIDICTYQIHHLIGKQLPQLQLDQRQTKGIFHAFYVMTLPLKVEQQEQPLCGHLELF